MAQCRRECTLAPLSARLGALRAGWELRLGLEVLPSQGRDQSPGVRGDCCLSFVLAAAAPQFTALPHHILWLQWLLVAPLGLVLKAVAGGMGHGEGRSGTASLHATLLSPGPH